MPTIWLQQCEWKSMMWWLIAKGHNSGMVLMELHFICLENVCNGWIHYIIVLFTKLCPSFIIIEMFAISPIMLVFERRLCNLTPPPPVKYKCYMAQILATDYGVSNQCAFKDDQFTCRSLNFFGPSDAIWHWGSWSTLVQVMACCQAIIWTIVDWSSVKSNDFHIRAISQEIHQPSITKIHLKITYWYITLICRILFKFPRG